MTTIFYCTLAAGMAWRVPLASALSRPSSRHLVPRPSSRVSRRTSAPRRDLFAASDRPRCRPPSWSLGSVTADTAGPDASDIYVRDDIVGDRAGRAKSKEDDLELTRAAILEHLDFMNGAKSTAAAKETASTTAPGNEDTSSPTALPAIETPSVLKILRYTVPAIGIWLCSPILSLIDTAAVGLLSGTAQQAALSPAVR